ncbi:POTRA domain-containing protein [Botrimarina sp.]|uniref:BamA/OMP85 family outer membrane protein n=1 Tax=Botrimarina sp. TaxID=2795802 RepID=UPI0032EEC9E2
MLASPTARIRRIGLSIAGLVAVVAPCYAPAQGLPGGGFGSSPAARPPMADLPTRRASGGLSEFATDELVAEVTVRGNATVPAKQITDQMSTRVGRPFDSRVLAADIKRLASLPYFVTVRPLSRSTPDGRVIVLEVTERRTLRYVEYLGNKSFTDKRLGEETGLVVGGAIDPYAVEEGRRKIEALYREKGFGRAFVKIEEGADASDHGVTYSIHEGPKQAIHDIEFEGNRFATDSQLKHKVQSKPGFGKWVFFPHSLNEEELDADVEALTSYYRSFGFFRARIGRTVRLSDDGKRATVRFAISEGPRYNVRNVTLNGVEVFPAEEVRAGLTLQPGQPFEQLKMQVDIAWLQDLYGSRGYVFADIRPETVFLEEPGLIDLVYNITEGESWRVGQIFVNIKGDDPNTRIPVALNPLSIQPGDTLDTRKLRDSERRLKNLGIFVNSPAQGQPPEITYQVSEQTKQWLAERERKKQEKKAGVFRGQNAGYAASEPASGWRSAPTEAAPAAQSGSVYQARQAPASYPAQQAFAPSGAGDPGAVGATDPYSASGVSPGLPVQQLGAAPPGPPVVDHVQYPAPGFAPVDTQLFPTQVYAPTPVPPPTEPFADIYVNLEETQTGRFMIGAAVNSDAGLVGQILIDERHFDWRRFPRSYDDFWSGRAFRGGGQRLRLEAAPGTEVQRYLASWQDPYFLDSNISLSLSGSLYDRRFDDWDENRLGGRIGLGYQWVERDLSAQVTYRGENVKIRQVSDPTVPELAEALGDNALHGFGLRLVTDKRDNPFLATEGYYLATTFEQVVGSFDYPRVEIDGRTYWLVRERPDHTGRHVMNFQTRVGFTGSNTPVYDRFYAGGFSTLRGYSFRGASPVAGPLNARIGGDFMFINTLEYLFPITADDSVNGVLFVDHGTVNEDISLDDYRVAPGFGLRIAVPALGPAPIALDFAWAVAGPEYDDERVFSFNMGLQR